MEKLILNKKHFNSNNEYIGKADVSKWEGHIEIEAGLGLVWFERIVSAGRIVALAGSGIEAGLGIKAGWDIEAGLGITCKKQLSSELRIFAGLCLWRKPKEEELKITCGILVKGDICFGELVEIGIKEEPKIKLSEQDKTACNYAVIDGIKYQLTEVK